MFRKAGFGPTLLVYEFFRLLGVCATQVGRPTAALPASWYAAAPLLALPLVLQVLCQLEQDHAAVYGRLYVLTKGLSALGCITYIVRICGAAFSETNAIDYFAFLESKKFYLFVLFFLVDVILIIVKTRKKRKGGARDASFD